MEIYTKILEGSTSNRDVSVKNLLQYAASVLGEGWVYTESLSPDSSLKMRLIFTDPSGSGQHGWVYGPGLLISNGVESTTGVGEEAISVSLDPRTTQFTGLVWRASGGSIGIGYVTPGGLYLTMYLLIKFNGKYENNNLYAVAFNRASGRGPVCIHGTSDIGDSNQCSRSEIGSGVYLHPYYDPISGLTSTDVFGVRTMPSSGYALNGFVVKQGGTSYLSILGGMESEPNTQNALFVKM